MTEPTIAYADFSDPNLWNGKYIPSLHTKKRWLFLVGGGGSGKSVHVAQKEIVHTYLADNRLMCVRKIKDTLKDSMFGELCSVIERWGRIGDFEITKSPLYIKNKITGSDIVFRGCDDPEKLKSITGVTRAWIEEASELDVGDFDQIDLRLRGQGDMQITCTTNPISDTLWIKTRFWDKGENEDTYLLHTTYLDNKWVGSQYSKTMERLRLQDPRMYSVYALGEWGKGVVGQIYNGWTIVENIPPEARLVSYGLDFGFTNDPTAMVAIYEYDGGMIYDEIVYRTDLHMSDLHNLVGHTLDRSIMVYADSASPMNISELERLGWRINGAKKGAGSIEYGIATISSHPISFTARSTNTIKEARIYSWKVDKAGNSLNIPIDAYNHSMDAMRYGETGIKGVKPGGYMGFISTSYADDDD